MNVNLTNAGISYRQYGQNTNQQKQRKSNVSMQNTLSHDSVSFGGQAKTVAVG